MNFTADHSDSTVGRLFVYFCGEKNVSKAAMKTWVLPQSDPTKRRATSNEQERRERVRGAVRESEGWNNGEGKRAETRFIGSMDKVQATRGIIIHPDKMGSAANKVCLLPSLPGYSFASRTTQRRADRRQCWRCSPNTTWKNFQNQIC